MHGSGKGGNYSFRFLVSNFWEGKGSGVMYACQGYKSANHGVVENQPKERIYIYIYIYIN